MVAQRQKLQSLFGGAIQRQGAKDETVQSKSGTPAQLKKEPTSTSNKTGLPDNLKSGIESLSGIPLDNVKVHYNSSQPAQLNALAYAQGTDIHVAPGQEKHLPHEAWHVVQQAQGRVKPTMQMKDRTPVNDDKGLEHEADVMGGRVVQRLVASASEGPKDDRVFQNTTLVAHTMVGGKIKKMSDVDFSSDFGNTTENLAITAHGSINKVGDYSGPQVANKLVDQNKGLQEGTHEIFFQSCYAAVEGAPNPTDTPTSVISTVKDALTARAKVAGWTKTPSVSGSYGPQIVVRIPKDLGGYDIKKAVVNPKLVPHAGAIQKVLQKVITDVKQEIILNFGKEGQDFIAQAEQDEAKVNELKLVFIHIISGEPGNIDSQLLDKIKLEWKSQGQPDDVGKQLFEQGVDLRSKSETVTL
jgi:hypothetical protein